MPQRTESPYRWTVMVTAFLGVFGAIGVARFGYSAVLPQMQEALGLSGAAAGSLASWNLIAYVSTALIGGLLASKFGVRIIMSIGIALTAVGLLLTGLSPDLMTASAARVVTGVGNGLVGTPALALMASWFAPRRLGLASAVVASGAALGLVVVGAAVPAILSLGGDEGWRLAWYVLAGVSLLMAVLNALVLRNRPPTPPGPVDLNLAETPRVLREFAGIVRSAFGWHLGLVYLLYGFAFISFLTFFQRRLIGDLGYSTEAAGYLYLVCGVAGIVFCLAYGSISDRLGRGRAMAILLLLEAIAALLFGLRPGTTALVVAAIIFGSGGFSMPGLMSAACGEHYGPRMAAASIGFTTVFFGLGQAVGPFLSGFVADATSSYGPPYLLASGVFLVSAVAAWFVDGRYPRRDEV